MEIHVLGGDDYVNGFGQGGRGHALPRARSWSTGGDGNDVLLRGSTLDDVVDGGAGNDVLEGNDGDRLARRRSGQRHDRAAAAATTC